MKKQVNRFLSLLLTVVLAAGLLPTAVWAVEENPPASLSDEQIVAAAREELTWESLTTEPQNAVTDKPTLPVSLIVEEDKSVTVEWICDDTTGAFSISKYDSKYSSYVDRPAAEDVSCTLTATLTYHDVFDTKSFDIIIKAEGVNSTKTTVVSYGDLLSGIAGGYSASTDAWVVLEMAAYNGSKIKGDNYTNYSPTAEALADVAIGETVSSDTLDSVDITGSYAIYTIPYLSLSYQAAGLTQGNESRMDPMKTAMVDYLNNLSDYNGADDVAPILSALAPYYHQEDETLDKVVDKAVTWLSQQQNSDGTFSSYGTSNANSTALVVVALSALGIDAHTDSRFIKNYKSALEGLFSFALADCSAFGYKGNVTANPLATEQGFRALVSYAKMKESSGAYNIYLQAKDSQTAVDAPNISVTTPPASPSNGGHSSPTTYRITVSVMVPPEGGADGQYTYVRDSSKYTNLLGSTKTVTATAETTALDVLTTALNQSNISYTENNGYVSEIGGLSEKDHGQNSGWKYMVDGVSPSESASTYTFAGSGKLVWYYTDDYLREEDGSAWNDSSSSDNSNSSSSKPSDNLTANTENTASTPLPFSDVSDHWASEAIRAVYEKGWMTGTGNTEFSPNAPANRAMIATVLWNVSGGEQVELENPFSDVADDAWYLQAVAWAVKAGVVTGYDNGTFGGNDSITREQLVSMLYQCAVLQGGETTADDQLALFQDGDLVSPWAVPAMNWAIHAGILSGKPGSILDPAGTATRGEIAVMVQNFGSMFQK